MSRYTLKMINNFRGKILALLLFTQVYGQSIQPELIKSLPSNLEPGTRNTVVFRIKNNLIDALNLEANVQSPFGWKLFYNKNVKVNGNSVGILPIGIIIPLDTKPGFYQLELELKNTTIDYSHTISFETHILKQIDFDIKIVNAPELTMAGKDILADFSIYNKSNSQRRIFLQSTYGTINGAKSLTLDVGETKVVNVFYPTNPDLNNMINKYIDLIVSSGPYKKSEKTYVKVIPIKKYRSDKFHRLPSELSLMYLYRNFGDYTHNGFQGNFYSNGALTPDGDKYLELRVRGPDQFDNSILGLYDEYYLKYFSKKTNILIGDETFKLTPLTEYGRYGTGVQAEYKEENTTLGFFYMQPRFYPDYDEEVAAFIKHNFDESNSIGVSFLQKSIEDVKDPINIYSAQYKITPYENIVLDAEYSFGKENEDVGYGYSIELVNQTEKTYAAIELINAGKDFPGYYSDTRYLNGNLQYVMNKNLKVFANFHEDESNAARDTLFGVAPYSKYLIGGATISYRKNDYINLNIGSRERKDRMPLQKFHYDEVFGRISLVNNVFSFQTNLNYEFGETKNLLTDSQGQSHKGALAIRWRPSRSLNISSFLQYYNTSRYSEDRSEEYIYGGAATYNFKNSTTVNLSYQNSHNIEEYYRDRSLLDLKISKFFNRIHEVEFSWSEALKQKQIDDRDTYIGLKYTFHFGIPVKKVKDLGNLRGRLINHGVKNISNVVVNLGGRIQLTDEDGLFVFNDVPAGEHYLYIDNGSLNLNDIAMQKMPLLINIISDELTDIQIGLTKSASLAGRVKLAYEDQLTKKLAEDAASVSGKNVIVEIKLDEEYYRTVVDLNDDFIFTGLRPGRWTVKVYHNSLGTNYTINNSEMIVNLKAAESSSVNIDVTKKARRIRFQPTEIIVN